MTNPQVSVRMYRHGLGDCLLVSIPSARERPFRLMIDCGVIQGSENASANIQAVVRNIIEETGGYVDVLAVTHEHWDHVSGFTQAEELFAPGGRREPGKLAVGEVWLAWTEDESDPLARKLGIERQQSLRALQGFVGGMQQALGANDLRFGLSELLGFFGAASGGTTRAMDNAKKLGKRSRRYCRPSDAPWEHDDLPGIRIYTLGPPPDERMIKRTFVRNEVYHEFANNALAESFFAAASVHEVGEHIDPEVADLYYPFDRGYGHGAERWLSDKARRPASPRLTPEESTFFDESYGNEAEAWRRIDHDWYGAAADLALRLDSATNNTSLVLAVEIVQTGQVLLFAADAQVGNWLSWQQLSWRLSDGSTVTGPDLLGRTVFYKVGHHGSHNATLKEKGLELMSREGFVAFLPVDVAEARKKRWNRMPLPKLVKALHERARGRVVQLDSGVHDIHPSVRRDFESRLTQTGLYFEYRVGG